MIDNIVFVVKNNKGQYLNAEGEWVSSEYWKYQSYTVFHDAFDHHGKVFMQLPNGKEVEVSEADFTNVRSS